MMIVSFAWTASELVKGNKSVTRRTWKDDYANRFKPGELVQAWDKTPRVKGAKKVAIIRITKVYKERLGDMPESDIEAEGGRWHDKKAFIGAFGGDPNLEVWVLRFDLIEVLQWDGHLRY